MQNVAFKQEIDGMEPVTTKSGCGINRIEGEPNSYELVMNGPQTPGWVGRLAAGLAQHRIGIVRGEAEKVAASSWHSRFELRSAPFAVTPLKLDFTTIAATEAPRPATMQHIELVDFVMHPSPQGDGTLIVEVKGVDRLGFLGDLLDYFSMRCLFPVRMTVETVAGQAVDRFWLRGVGGSTPSESIRAAVRENLERLLVGKNQA